MKFLVTWFAFRVDFTEEFSFIISLCSLVCNLFYFPFAQLLQYDIDINFRVSKERLSHFYILKETARSNRSSSSASDLFKTIRDFYIYEW